MSENVDKKQILHLTTTVVRRRVSADNMCDFQHSSSLDDCAFGARLVNQTRKEKQTIVLRCCQDGLRSPTLTERKDTLRTCGSFVALKLCQLILVQPIQCTVTLQISSSSRCSCVLSEFSPRCDQSVFTMLLVLIFAFLCLSDSD